MDETTHTEEPQQSEYLATRNPLAHEPQPNRIALETETEREPNDRDRGVEEERKRGQGIVRACRAARLPSSFADKLIDEGLSLVDAQSRIFRELELREDPNGAPSQGARGQRVEVTGEDPFVMARSGVENALLHRVAPQHFQLDDNGRRFRGMTMLDVAKAYLSARGMHVGSMGKMELAGVALGLTQVRGGMHTTSDFPFLLADVANKTLRAEYAAAPQTFMPITRPVTLTDFKPSNRIQIGDAPALQPINEHGEFTRGKIAEGREQIQLAEYGRVFAITRKALVNDDTDAFSRVPMKFGRMARNLESDLVWFQILSNPAMGDTFNLFSSQHANLDAVGAQITIDSISAAEQAMLLQTGLDGSTLVQAQPRYLIVPPSLKTRALQFVSVNMQAQQATNVNPYAGVLQVIAEPRLQTGITIGTGINQVTAVGSDTAWYVSSTPDQVDVLEMAMLEGQEGPLVESRIGFDVDGLEIKCRHDVGAKAIDHRGLYKSIGETLT